METLIEGHYAQKQLGSKSKIIAWSHGSRFQKAVELVNSLPKGNLLDYGCGDGTFLAMVARDFPLCVGSDIAQDQVVYCNERFKTVENAAFYTVDEMLAPGHTGKYRIITCMETLEHCPPAAVQRLLDDLVRLAAPDATIIISVPIEIGPTFLLKYSIRKVAGWRGIGDYKSYESYSIPNALKMLFATSRTDIERPVYGPPHMQSHSHYGFNWRQLHRRLEKYLAVERTLFSPLGFLGRWFGSQVWLICRVKPDVK